MEKSREFLEQVASIARKRGVFASIEVEDALARCRARDAENAWYLVRRDGDHWSVALETPDRWLSESIEADLMHHGDPLEELIEEELVELGGDAAVEPPKHFRDEQRRYVFVNRIPRGADASAVANWLLAYEAAFRNLGDMSGAEKE